MNLDSESPNNFAAALIRSRVCLGTFEEMRSFAMVFSLPEYQLPVTSADASGTVLFLS